MIEFLDKASEKFFNNILNLKIQNCKTKNYSEALCSKISIYKNNNKYDIVFLFKKTTINLISKHLLFEKKPDNETIYDLLKEIANLIAGNAKILMEENDNKSIYTLSTPEYMGIIRNVKELNLSNILIKKVHNKCFTIGIEEI